MCSEVHLASVPAAAAADRVCGVSWLLLCVCALCVCGAYPQVHDRNDHGLLEAVLHPDFANGKPYLYLHVSTIHKHRHTQKAITTTDTQTQTQTTKPCTTHALVHIAQGSDTTDTTQPRVCPPPLPLCLCGSTSPSRPCRCRTRATPSPGPSTCPPAPSTPASHDTRYPAPSLLPPRPTPSPYPHCSAYGPVCM